MNREQGRTPSPSYFWHCLTLSEECPFFSTIDPKLYYFAVGLTGAYIAFILMILIDLKFYWSLDAFQRQIDYYINLVRKKVRHVQMDQRRLVTTQERTEKQLKRSLDCRRVVTALRGALSADDRHSISMLTRDSQDTISGPRRSNWSASVIDF